MNHVEFCGSSKTPEKVIATQGRRLYMADVATSQVLASETVSLYILDFFSVAISNQSQLGVDTVYKASFSPHPPSGSLICTGGTDKLLAIIDSRILGKSASMNVSILIRISIAKV